MHVLFTIDTNAKLNLVNWLELTSLARFWKLVRKCPLGNVRQEMSVRKLRQDRSRVIAGAVCSVIQHGNGQGSACNRRSAFKSRIACKHSTSDFQSRPTFA